METPCYVYDIPRLQSTLEGAQLKLKNPNSSIQYAVETNYNVEVLKKIAELGYGANCANSEEARRALKAGFSMDKIALTSEDKNDEEIYFTIERGVKTIHCGDLDEAYTINRIAKSIDKRINVVLRLNLTTAPNLKPEYAQSLFSNVEFEEFSNVQSELNYLNINGIHFHVDYHSIDVDVLESVCQYFNYAIRSYRMHFETLTYIGLGGVHGLSFQQSESIPIHEFDQYFEIIESNLKHHDVKLYFEFGEALVNSCGRLFTKVLDVKTEKEMECAVIDAGLISPNMSNIGRNIEFVGIAFKKSYKAYDVVNVPTEPSNQFRTHALLPSLKPGDLLSINNCGANAESLQFKFEF